MMGSSAKVFSQCIRQISQSILIPAAFSSMQTNWDAPVQIFLNLCSSLVEDDRRQQRQESRDLRYFLSIAKGRYAECSRLVAPEYRLSAKTSPIPKSGSFMTASSLEKTLQAK